MTAKDITGQRFGQLTVIDRAPNRGNVVMWRCLCDCGKLTVTRGTGLRYGHVVSCGHIQRDKVRLLGFSNKRHGETKTRLYNILNGMKGRCHNPKHTEYRNYGGRGIKVCDAWRESYLVFKLWALSNGYGDKLTIERLDVNGDYEPSNCCFIPKSEQWKNTRKHLYVTNPN